LALKQLEAAVLLMHVRPLSQLEEQGGDSAFETAEMMSGLAMRGVMRLGLKEETIEAVNGVFRSCPAIERAVLYGSRAKGTFRPGSDIDLTLEGEGIRPDEMAKIEQALDDLLLPYKFDVSLFHQLTHPGLADHIRRVGVTFFQREAD
jgi:predicted nucleotidyltransferase